MLKSHLLPFPHSKRLRRPRRILNLSPINIPLRQRRNLLRRDQSRRSPDLRDKRFPDLYFGFLRKIVEMERHVDTGEEGFVECLDSIGGEEKNTTIVFDVTETIKYEKKDKK